MPARHYGEFELLDFSGSKSSFSVYFGAITAVSIAGFLTQFGNLRAALQNIVKGTISRERWVGDETTLSNIPPVDDSAQRELFWHVEYKAFSAYDSRFCRIATPDTSLLLQSPERIDYANPDVAAFITAWETLVIDPRYPGEPVSVHGIFIGGRDY